jgi:hypothetical protein
MHKRPFTRAAGVSPNKSGGVDFGYCVLLPVSSASDQTRAATVSPNKSGGRQPPVGSGIALTASGKGCRMAAAERGPRRLVGGGLSVVYRELTCSCVSGTTAGLRQPLLLHDVRSPGNDLLQCGVAHAPRAASVSPPWLRTASAAAIAHTPAAIDCYTRAGGVSPPWVREPHLQLVAKVAEWLLASVSPPWFNQRRCKRERFPRLAHADCSWRTTLRPAGE